MSKTKTRAGALLPVAAVFVAVMMLAAPAIVLSDDADADATDGPFYVGETSYTSLADAVTAAAGGTVTLKSNATLTAPCSITATDGTIINLGGYTLNITGAANDRIGITVASGSVIVTNGTIQDDRTVDDAYNNKIIIAVSGNNSTLTTTNVTFIQHKTTSTENYNYAVRVEKGATLYMNQGTSIKEIDSNGTAEGGINYGVVGVAIFGQGPEKQCTSAYFNGATIVTSSYAIAGNGSVPSNPDYRNTYIEVNSGTYSSSQEAGIYHPQVGTMVINGGSISGVSGVEIRAGTLTVNGGTITGTAAFTIKNNGSGQTTTGVGLAIAQHTTKLPITVTINGGTISSNSGYGLLEANPQNNGSEYIEDIVVSINGGTFSGGSGYDAVKVVDYTSEPFEYTINGEATTYNGTETASATITSGSFNTDVSAYVSSDVDVKWVDGEMYVGDSIPSDPVIIIPDDNRVVTPSTSTTTGSSSDDTTKVVACAAAAVAAALMAAFALLLSKKD